MNNKNITKPSDLKSLLVDLVKIPGVPSCEKQVKNFISDFLKKQNPDELTTTPLGNLIAVFKGTDTKLKPLLIDAHMDEVGFIVQHIEKSGFLRFVAMGSVDSRVILSQKLVVHSSSGKEFYGVVGLLPPHVQGKKEPVVIPIEDLFIDCGFTSAKEVASAGIRVGSQITFDSQVTYLQNNMIACKAIDDRAGCAVLLKIAQNLSKKRAKRTIALSFSVQEEGGTRGIQSVASIVEPEYALVVESTTACDVPGVAESKMVARVDSGCAFTVADGTINISPELLDTQIKIATKHKIKHQLKTPKFGGTNAGSLHVTGKGVKTCIVSAPVRYLHSSVSAVSLTDLEDVLTFANAFIQDL